MKFSDKALLDIHLEKINTFHRGKVRNVYAIEDKLLIVATDRISAFDAVFPNGIPGKGQILTAISNHWFKIMNFVENHIIETDVKKFPAMLRQYSDLLDKRAVIVKKCKRIDLECIVRGYLAGSGWKDYQETGEICGYKIPKGLKQADKLPKPIFTPSTKAEQGHDENITMNQAADMFGLNLVNKIEEISLKLYQKASSLLIQHGIIIADTKFEFGIDDNNNIIVIDEILTPDSSRFWPADSYKIGISPPSFDKQFVRDFLETTNWDKRPPAPVLPDDIINKTREKYLNAYQIISKIF